MTATLERGLNALREQIDAPVASFFTSCVSCGLCAEACLFYTETEDPKYTPIHKLDLMKRMWQDEYTLMGRVKSLLGLGKPITEEEMASYEELVYDSCTMCGRCTLVCPVGNDITLMVRKMREGMSAAGYGPVEMIGAAQRHLDKGGPMGNLWKALGSHIARIEHSTDLKINVDKEGVDYLVVLSSQEVVEFNDVIEAMAKIFDKAGVSWTFSTEGLEATNVGVQLGSSDIAREFVSRVVGAAEKLKVKGIISPECGHAYQALRWEGPNLIGRTYPFEVVHIIELLDKLASEGKLKTKGKDTARLTFHDPCQINRRGGINKEPRRLLGMVAENFVETEDAGTMNWCCGGGGGVGSNESANEIRFKAFNHKKRQFEGVGAEKVVTMCAYCHHILEESLEHYELDDKIEVQGLTELMAAYLED